jgi:glucose-1-phosphate adenylyltransferase
MDYGTMLAAHVEKEADVTVGCIEVPLEEASAFGVMAADENDRIFEFAEKPANPKHIPGDPNRAMASMGIYIFSTDVLFEELRKDHTNENSSHDFGKDIIPSLLERKKVHAFPFRDPDTHGEAYWRDVGTVDALWKANLELTTISPELNLYDRDWPIWTHQEQLPPAKFVFDDDGRRGMAVDSMVAGGCIISGASVKKSMLFSQVHVHSYADVSESVIMPDVSIGRHCRVHRAIIDRGCRLEPGMEIGIDPEKDAKSFFVSPGGIVLVTPEMLNQDYPHGL